MTPGSEASDRQIDMREARVKVSRTDLLDAIGKRFRCFGGVARVLPGTRLVPR